MAKKKTQILQNFINRVQMIEYPVANKWRNNSMNLDDFMNHVFYKC